MDYHTPGGTSPSNLYKRWKCPASGMMEAMTAYCDGPEEDSEYAARGRELHGMAKRELGIAGSVQDLPDEVSEYIAFIENLSEEHDFVSHAIEKRICIMEGMRGTADYIGEYPWDAKNRPIDAVVVDLKTGYIPAKTAASSLIN